ncbi:hypothetical protein [Rhodobacter maris]|uniref:Uncharacterized protein n=1 Tax=Rhodobacter maris TaxID=446682 RepID=A0A285SQL6_9RHOB|nr:hypothetical protein [Rhodobacter maris]SOC10429.1 hypothetical protein SAMN05877831_10865 [Rhodobacter maris]
MVWSHILPHPAHQVTPGPWFVRALARLRLSFSKPAPEAEPRRTAQADLTAQPEMQDIFAEGFTRVAPLHQLPMAPHVSSVPTPISALTAFPAEPPPHTEAASASRRTISAANAAAAPTTRPAAAFHAVEVENIALVMVLSRRSGAPIPCLEWLGDHGLPFRRIAALAPTSPIWSAPHGALLIVDLDTLGGVTAMAEGLMRLRQGRPDISVVLLSEEVAGHDFGIERLALADVTLRLPCAFASFEFALAEAPINNAIWQERMAEVQPEF